ncbi:hypothetical protein AB3N04_19735 [Alkalihalophilus sp. As8PL]|uniref:Lipoprotein n=1 Tax=Alkalihalophilus sp. As8PL TaxID=3237103 RepID=A0AB39BTM8_9BACI
MKKCMVLLLTLSISLIAACGTDQSIEENELENPVMDETVDKEVDEGEIELGNEKESTRDEENEGEGVPSNEIELAHQKELEVNVEGQTEKKMATFNRSGLGYSIYVIEDYTLHSEEPGRDALTFNHDGDFFTRIIPHGEEVDASELKERIEEHAEGEIEVIQHVPLDDVEYALVERVKSNGESTTLIHVAKRFEGELFQMTLFLPAKEAQEGVAPSMWAMLETIKP